MTKRIEYIAKIQEVVDCFGEDIEILYGYLDGNLQFVQSDVDINTDKEKYERILVKYKGQDNRFGVVQSIEMDGYYYILKDVISAIDRM